MRTFPGAVLGLVTSLAAQESLPIRSAIAIERAFASRRSPVAIDAVAAPWVRGALGVPRAGDALALPGGEQRHWTSLEVGKDALALPRGGWAQATVTAPHDGVWLLQAKGHGLAIAGGEARAGDPYGLGLVALPVALRHGDNPLLLRAGRGPCAVQLVPPPAAIFLAAADRTLPDAILGRTDDLLAGIPVVNATTDWQGELKLWARGAGAERAVALPVLAPLATRKIAVPLAMPAAIDGAELVFALELRRGDAVLHADRCTLAVRRQDQHHRRTFRSSIDGSVQYFAVAPRLASAAEDPPPALVLTLHGAGVEAEGQARCYALRDDAVFVAPTNRRPFGFDWEDWGRLDALEVLAHAQAWLRTDPRRVTLTGHSMGGHGTWQLGVHFPDRFAAIAPSAGWRSFATYGGGAGLGDSPIERLWARASGPSDTLRATRNLERLGVYVLHGDADDNVPVGEARAMRSELAAFHPDFAYREQPGAGHWWGNECVDWPPLVRFLLEHRRPAARDVRQVRFTTTSPGVSARCEWITVEAQQQWLAPTTVEATLDPGQRRIDVETDNAARIALDLAAFAAPPDPVLAPGVPLAVEVDGEARELAWPQDARLRLERDTLGRWQPAPPPDPFVKGPHRCGPFKDAFRQHMLLVVGTRGTPEENGSLLARARYDAETWGYRGNGDVDLVRDVDFAAAAEPERSVILYGNADTNAAWPTVLARCPIEVRRGHVRVGERVLEGEDLACLLVYPRAGSTSASVGVVAGTGLAGLRATVFVPYFVSGVALPDWTVLGAEVLEQGIAGVRGTGFFDGAWALDAAMTAWR